MRALEEKTEISVKLRQTPRRFWSQLSSTGESCRSVFVRADIDARAQGNGLAFIVDRVSTCLWRLARFLSVNFPHVHSGCTWLSYFSLHSCWARSPARKWYKFELIFREMTLSAIRCKKLWYMSSLEVNVGLGTPVILFVIISRHRNDESRDVWDFHESRLLYDS